MKLLNSNVSPFAARVRLAIYAHDLPVEIAPSGQWLPNYEKSPAYLAVNPIGKVPTLILDDGSALPESAIILEYLADAFPAAGLRPSDARTAARARLCAQIVEHYVQMPAGPLFGQLFAGERDWKRIEGCISSMDEGLSHLDHFLEGQGLPGSVTLQECALVPFIYFFAEKLVSAFQMPAIVERHPRVAAYWDRAQTLPAVQKVLGEMRAAIGSSRLSMLVAGETLDRGEEPTV